MAYWWLVQSLLELGRVTYTFIPCFACPQLQVLHKQLPEPICAQGNGRPSTLGVEYIAASMLFSLIFLIELLISFGYGMRTYYYTCILLNSYVCICTTPVCMYICTVVSLYVHTYVPHTYIHPCIHHMRYMTPVRAESMKNYLFGLVLFLT